MLVTILSTRGFAIYRYNAMTSSIEPTDSAADNPSEYAAAFHRDGVVCLRNVLDVATLAAAQDAFQWSLDNPGPGAAELPVSGGGSFYQDLANPKALPAYQRLLVNSELGDVVARLWDSTEVWFMYEQVFAKHGGDIRRTPWHQDAPYLPVRGEQLAVMWLSFEPVPASRALEFVRGSHRGVIYDGSRFSIADDTAPIYGDGTYPRLPDIESSRSDWPIVSWSVEPGDVLVFHPAVLHGGGATAPDTPRRTLSLRFFGRDATVAERPGRAPVEQQADGSASDVHPLSAMRLRKDGEPFRDDRFLKLRG